MKVLKSGFDLKDYFSRLAKAKKRALLLDYDGTLAPFRVERNQAYPYPGVTEILDELLEDGNCRVVIVSGRWIKDLIPLLNLKKMPEIWGSHGWERLMPDKSYTIHEMNEQYIKGLANADDWVVKEGFQDRCEQKPGCLALHWRGLDSGKIEDIRNKAMKYWAAITFESGLEIHEFNGGVELRAPGRDKGFAVKKIISEMGEGVATYLGDDYTDEDGFKALNSDGLGVLVGEKPRPTAADLWLKPPDELLQFLTEWKNSCRGGSP